jgi:hypothetical protein
MHKINSTHATPENEFTDGNPATGIEATEIISKWLNTVQRELVALVQYAGLTLSDSDDDQVTEAISSLLSAHANLTAPHSAAVLVAPNRLVLRDGYGRSEFAEGVSGGHPAVMSQFPVVNGTYGKSIHLPNGIKFQCGFADCGYNAYVTYDFPEAFNTSVFSITATGSPSDYGLPTHEQEIFIKNVGLSQFAVAGFNYNGRVGWLAIGN